MRIIAHIRFTAWLLAAAGLLVSAGCAMDKQDAPTLAGPSGYALSISMSASPDVLARDGSSTSTIQLIARNADGKPAIGQRFLLGVSAGTLTETDVMTDRAGQVTFGFMAPGVNVNATSAEIFVSPVGTNADNTLDRRVVSVRLLGPAFPVATFTFSPAAPGQFDLVSFDASGSTLGGSSCTSCTYTWDFGDGTIGNGRLTSHRFGSRGSFAVTLTVTTNDGTSATAMKIVTVGAPQEIDLSSKIKWSPTKPVPGKPIVFDGRDVKTPDGAAIVDYQWDFLGGEPATGSGPTATTTFADAGVHVVRLTVTDAAGRTATTTAEVEVALPETPTP
jgi:PKD repeat protein